MTHFNVSPLWTYQWLREGIRGIAWLMQSYEVTRWLGDGIAFYSTQTWTLCCFCVMCKGNVQFCVCVVLEGSRTSWSHLSFEVVSMHAGFWYVNKNCMYTCFVYLYSMGNTFRALYKNIQNSWVKAKLSQVKIGCTKKSFVDRGPFFYFSNI